MNRSELEKKIIIIIGYIAFLSIIGMLVAACFKFSFSFIFAAIIFIFTNEFVVETRKKEKF